MEAKKLLPRRAFLLALTAVAFSLGLPFRRAAAQREVARSVRELMQAELPAARSIGHFYLSEPGHRQSAIETLKELQRLQLWRPADIARHIQARRRSDFSHGAVFVQDGWVFADIEARICAIIALT